MEDDRTIGAEAMGEHGHMHFAHNAIAQITIQGEWGM
jgi:hypothetical protein